MSISEIKNKLKKFEVFQCGLHHELVKLNSNSKLPIKTKVSNEDVYQRVELCNLNKRKYRLGCAHSSSNKSFSNLISLLKTDNSEIKILQNKIDKLITKIYLLDHEKGNLEKEFAINIENKSKSIDTVKAKINDCKHIHRNYMNDLSILKENLLRLIN